MDLVAFGCGRLRPQGGDRRRGTARLLRVAEMRLKASGSAAGGSAAGGRGCCAGHRAGEAGESRGAGSALSGLVIGWALLGAGLMLSSVKGGGENGLAPPPLGCADPTIAVLRHAGGQAWGASGAWGSRALGPGGGGGGGQCLGRCHAPAGRWGARVREGLGRGLRPVEPGGQRRRPRAPVLRNKDLAARRDPRRCRRPPQARRRAAMPLVAGAAAAADAPPQAFAPGAQGRPVLQAEHAPSAAPLPAPGGRLRCRAARGTLKGGGREGLLAYSRSSGTPSGGRG